MTLGGLGKYIIHITNSSPLGAGGVGHPRDTPKPFWCLFWGPFSRVGVAGWGKRDGVSRVSVWLGIRREHLNVHVKKLLTNSQTSPQRLPLLLFAIYPATVATHRCSARNIRCWSTTSRSPPRCRFFCDCCCCCCCCSCCFSCFSSRAGNADGHVLENKALVCLR